MALAITTQASPNKTKQTLDPTSSLRAALADFEGCLAVEQKQRLHGIAQVPDATSVFEFVTQIDADNKSRARRCVAARLCTFLDAIQQFSAVVSAFVDSNPAVAALVWGSVKLAILTASNVASYFDKVTNLIMTVGKLCPMYQRFGHVFPGCLDLQNALCEYYAVVVRLSMKIIEVLARATVTQFLSSMWNPFESEFKLFLGELKQSSDTVQLAISLASSTAVQRAYEDQRKHNLWTTKFRSDAKKEFVKADSWRNELVEKEARRLRLSIKDNLSNSNRMKYWKQARRERIPGTAEWLQQESPFLEWLSDADTAALWCSGTMGTGKTIIASQVVAHLYENRKQSDIIAYHFCRSDSSNSLLARNILGALARQMLELQIERINLSTLEQMYKDSQELDEQGVTEFILAHLGKGLQHYIIIDGLDECEETQIRRFVVQVADLLKESTAQLKVLFTGRPDLESSIAKYIKPRYRISITKERNKADLLQYIDTRLQECLEEDLLKLSDQSLIAQISEALEDGSEGMFLWTRLLIEEVCEQNSDKDVLHALQRLPRTFSELLERKFSRIRSRNGASIALKMLEYCGVLKRPLNINEFQELLSLIPEQQIFDQNTMPNDMKRVVADCCGLVFVDDEEETIHYVHHSIRKYLFKEQRSGTEGFVEIDSDQSVGFLCLTYLNLDDFNRQLVKANNNLDAGLHPIELGIMPIAQSSSYGSKLAQIILRLKRQSPRLTRAELASKGLEILDPASLSPEPRQEGHNFYFLEYARSHWLYHFKYASEPLSDNMHKLFCACVDGTNQFAARPWLDEPAPSRDSHKLWSLTRWALLHGNVSLISYLVQSATDPSIKIFTRQAMQESTKTDHTHILRLFLRTLELVQGDLDDALLSAVIHCNVETTKVLLAEHAHIDTVEWLEKNFSQNRNVTLIPEARHDGPAYMLPPHSRRRPLLAAAIAGHLEMVELLLASGARVDAADPVNGWTALNAAVECGHISVVNRLLDAGAYMNHPSGMHQQTPLCSAVRKDHREIVERLLAAGVDIDFRTSDSEPTAFFYAMELGRLEIARLLAPKLDVNAFYSKSDSHPLLHVAIEENNLDMVQLLLTGGANPNQIARPGTTGEIRVTVPYGTNGRTALHLAAEKGLVEVVKRLLDAGADADLRTTHDTDNEWGQSALDIAISHRHTDVAQALLAALGKTHSVAPTVLAMANSQGYPELAKLIHGRRPPEEHNDKWPLQA